MKMKKDYVTGAEITQDEAIRAAAVIAQMNLITDGEFSTMLTEKYNLIRCSGEDEKFLDSEDIEKGKLPEDHEFAVVLSAENVASVVADYMKLGVTFDIYN
ncbi:hypothetical protein D3C85_1412060 [compost metagenome]